jgi:hypothetical protein
MAPTARYGARRSDPLFEAHTQGLADKPMRTVWIDPRMPLPAKTLLHELTHVRHPDWPEDRVAAYEEMRWNRMSWREKAHLYKLLGSAIIEGEK